jgi:hypothetical protein
MKNNRENKRKARAKGARVTATISFSVPRVYVPLMDARCQQLQVLPNRSQYICALILDDLEKAPAKNG